MDRNYEQEYKKAFEAAKGLHDAGNALTKKQMEIVFPQLAESDDERIRKFLIEMFSHGTWQKEWPFGPNEIVAYLEKQKEPHFTKRNALFDKCVENCDPEVMKKVSDEIDDMLQKEQKSAEWSEEDESMRCNILNALTPNLVYSVGKGTSTGTSTYKYDKEIAWLKSLRNRDGKEFLQPHWKPSEEQMKALLGAEGISRASGYPDNAKVLASLYEQLKKLM